MRSIGRAALRTIMRRRGGDWISTRIVARSQDRTDAEGPERECIAGGVFTCDDLYQPPEQSHGGAARRRRGTKPGGGPRRLRVRLVPAASRPSTRHMGRKKTTRRTERWQVVLTCRDALRCGCGSDYWRSAAEARVAPKRQKDEPDPKRPSDHFTPQRRQMAWLAQRLPSFRAPAGFSVAIA